VLVDLGPSAIVEKYIKSCQYGGLVDFPAGSRPEESCYLIDLAHLFKKRDL